MQNGESQQTGIFGQLSHFTEITPWTSGTQNEVEYSIDYLQSLPLLKYIVTNSATSHNHSHTN